MAGERFSPFLHGPSPQVAGVAEALECVDVIADRSGRHDIVGDRQRRARFQHAKDLVEEARDALEMVRGDAAGHEIERLVLERQRLRLRVGDPHVRELALGDLGADQRQHLLGDVGRPDALDVRRERIRRVAGAGCDVEGAPGRLRLRELHQSLEALALGVRLAGEIMRRRARDFAISVSLRLAAAQSRRPRISSAPRESIILPARAAASTA